MILRIYKYIRYIFMPLIPLYLAVFHIRKKIAKPEAISLPVLCIGNLTTGGSGKTPAVIKVVELLKQEGFRPGIISRGYGGTLSSSGGLVSDGDCILLSARESGDEAFLIALRLPDVPVAVAADRCIAVKLLQESADVDLILMDDGFQNNSVCKDICIISIDALNPFGNGLVLPAGDLREPKSALKRADIILLNKSDLADKTRIDLLVGKIDKISRNIPAFRTHYSDECIYSANNPEKIENANILKNKSILLVSGIGNPDAFFSSVKKYEPACLKHISYNDHHNYTLKDIRSINEASDEFDFILITEKDFVKIMDFRLSDKYFIFRNSIKIDNEILFREELLKQISRVKMVN